MLKIALKKKKKKIKTDRCCAASNFTDAFQRHSWLYYYRDVENMENSLPSLGKKKKTGGRGGRGMVVGGFVAITRGFVFIFSLSLFFFVSCVVCVNWHLLHAHPFFSSLSLVSFFFFFLFSLSLSLSLLSRSWLPPAHQCVAKKKNKKKKRWFKYWCSCLVDYGSMPCATLTIWKNMGKRMNMAVITVMVIVMAMTVNCTCAWISNGYLGNSEMHTFPSSFFSSCWLS